MDIGGSFGVFDDDNWDDIIEGDFIYLSREFPPKVYLIKKHEDKDDELYRLQQFKTSPFKFISSDFEDFKDFMKGELVKLKKFPLDEDKLIRLEDFNNDNIKEYIQDTIESFKNEYKSDVYGSMINIIENKMKLNSEIVYQTIRDLIKKLKSYA